MRRLGDASKVFADALASSDYRLFRVDLLCGGEFLILGVTDPPSRALIVSYYGEGP